MLLMKRLALDMMQLLKKMRIHGQKLVNLLELLQLLQLLQLRKLDKRYGRGQIEA